MKPKYSYKACKTTTQRHGADREKPHTFSPFVVAPVGSCPVLGFRVVGQGDSQSQHFSDRRSSPGGQKISLEANRKGSWHKIPHMILGSIVTWYFSRR